jgi:hypothetical protein
MRVVDVSVSPPSLKLSGSAPDLSVFFVVFILHVHPPLTEFLAKALRDSPGGH